MQYIRNTIPSKVRAETFSLIFFESLTTKFLFICCEETIFSAEKKVRTSDKSETLIRRLPYIRSAMVKVKAMSSISLLIEHKIEDKSILLYCGN